MTFSRSSGILLHPTSLPGPFGIGDLGEEAYKFVDFLAKSGQSFWQVLPLGPTGYGDSPYQCFSAVAGNPLLVNPEFLVGDGLLAETDLKDSPNFPVERIDFGSVIDYKTRLLTKAYENFKKAVNNPLKELFQVFCKNTASWLDGYALFRTLKDAHNGAAWCDWPKSLATREPAAIAEVEQQMQSQIEAHKFFQFLFFKQWLLLKEYTNQRGIKIIGDIPIFVAYDSSDVWLNAQFFKLNSEGKPTVVAGVPPDFFSKTGQLWGNPIYDWEKMAQNSFKWWIDRVSMMLKMVDVVRFDHFRGFAACWEIPAGDPTAENGKWVEVPGRELFLKIQEALGDLPIIAEDLGVITPDVEALRDDFAFPGMRILQFAFNSDSSSIDLPHNYTKNSVVYTGTHDNDTTAGWFETTAAEGVSAAVKRARKYCLEYLNTDGKEIHWDFIRAAYASVSDIAIVPAQDILGLGSDARMNLPASQQGNWNWRMISGSLTTQLAEKLAAMGTIYGRTPTLKNKTL
ncbi:MAG: 4-alpha-glucanotransferase [Blastocatellia bacterium]|nr:4-alpha-glucanotransferase [Blastocatellia bacterium]